MRKTNFVILTTVLLFVSICSANVLWTNSSGSAEFFNWSGGAGVNGLYGDPNLIGGDTLDFAPDSLRAQSLDGSYDRAFDGISFDISAAQGYRVDGVYFTVQGDYGFLGTGSVDFDSSLQIQNLDTLETINGTVSTSPEFPIDSGSGSWAAQLWAEPAPGDWTNIRITFDSLLFADSDCGGVSYLQTKSLGALIDMQVIPEPATVAFLSLGLVFFTRKKHNRTSR